MYFWSMLLSDWLERLLWGSLIMARGSSSQSHGQWVFMIFLVQCFLGSVYCFIVLWCVCLVPRPYEIYFMLLWPVCAESAVKHQSTNCNLCDCGNRLRTVRRLRESGLHVWRWLACCWSAIGTNRDCWSCRRVCGGQKWSERLVNSLTSAVGGKDRQYGTC